MNTYQIYFVDENNNKRVVSGGTSKELAINALKGTQHEGKKITWGNPIYGYLGMNTMTEGKLE